MSGWSHWPRSAWPPIGCCATRRGGGALRGPCRGLFDNLAQRQNSPASTRRGVTPRAEDLSRQAASLRLPDGGGGGDREASALHLAAHDWLASLACRTEPSVWSLRAHTGCTPMQEPRSPLCKGLSTVAACASRPWLWTVPDLARLYTQADPRALVGGQVLEKPNYRRRRYLRGDSRLCLEFGYGSPVGVVRRPTVPNHRCRQENPSEYQSLGFSPFWRRRFREYSS